MKKILGYFHLEFLNEIRSKETIIWSFIFPIILFLILNLTVGSAISGEEKGVTFRYAFIGEKGIYVDILHNIFEKVPVLKEKKVTNLEGALSLLKKEKLDIVISVVKNKYIGNKIDIYYVDKRPSSLLAKKIVEGMFNKIRLGITLGIQYFKYYALKNFMLNAWGIVPPFIEKLKPVRYEVKGLFFKEEKEFSYKDFLFPGILLMGLITFGAFNIPLKITLYREGGILKRFSVTPVSSFTLFAGNFLTLLSIVTIQVTIFTLFSKFVMGVHVVFSLKLFLYIFLVFLFSYTLGFSIATVSKTPQSANILGNAVFFPLQFLGGLYFSVNNAPWFLKWIIVINPLTYISSEIRELMGLSSSPYPDYLGFLVPVIWILILLSFVVKKFSWLGDTR